jgi:type I restriction enzyme, S subunit
MTTQVPLGSIIKLRKGRKASTVFDEHVNGACPYIQFDEVRGSAPQKYASNPTGVEVVPDDLCIVWDGANAGTVGYGLNGLIGSTVARMRFNDPDEWDVRFVGRLLQSKFLQLNEEAQARGATIPHVHKDKLEEISVPRLHKAEQRRIAAILDKADGIRRKREQTLVLADDFLRSAFVHLVGFEHPDFAGWKPWKIEDLAAPHKGAMRTARSDRPARALHSIDQKTADFRG